MPWMMPHPHVKVNECPSKPLHPWFRFQRELFPWLGVSEVTPGRLGRSAAAGAWWRIPPLGSGSGSPWSRSTAVVWSVTTAGCQGVALGVFRLGRAVCQDRHPEQTGRLSSQNKVAAR